MPKKLGESFFLRPARTVARALLGKVLVRRLGRKRLAGRIVETEAYVGIRDRASHAYGGRVTPRNLSEYLQGGHIYIYLCYGLYWQLNITVQRQGNPECVLIRALEPEHAPEAPPPAVLRRLRTLTAGPGRLCRWMRLGRSFDREDVTKSRRIWLEESGEALGRGLVVAAPRIGIDYAGEWALRPLRYYVKSNPFVSTFKAGRGA
jgi:DNA-3-methyladenine glycosylase